MLPPPRLRMTRKASRAKRKEPRALTAITVSQSSAVVSVTGLLGASGVVHQDVEASEGVLRRGDRVDGGLLPRDVAPHREDTGVCVLQGRDVGTQVDGDDAGAAGMEQCHGLLADAACGPGDQGGPPGELGCVGGRGGGRHDGVLL
ncbi:hypothetical protein SALBM217S_10754 [Streptomyces griseoloalbus]